MKQPVFQEALRLHSCQDLGSDYFLLCLELPTQSESHSFIAGQFAQLSIPGLTLPRPFSILRVRDQRMELLVKQVGPGTSWLAALRVGDSVDTVWPLGRGFQDRNPEEGHWLLVGGGVGVAPMIALAEERGSFATSLRFGFRNKAQAEALLPLCPSVHDIQLTTEDGSLGTKGFVTALLDEGCAGHAPGALMCCGPDPMMKAVADLCERKSWPCYMSLETYMGCGIGICVGCAVPLEDGRNALCCQEGPVFPAASLRRSLT